MSVCPCYTTWMVKEQDKLLGDLDERILQALLNADGSLTTREISEQVGANEFNARRALTRLVRKGIVAGDDWSLTTRTPIRGQVGKYGQKSKRLTDRDIEAALGRILSSVAPDPIRRSDLLVHFPEEHTRVDAACNRLVNEGLIEEVNIDGHTHWRIQPEDRG